MISLVLNNVPIIEMYVIRLIVHALHIIESKFFLKSCRESILVLANLKVLIPQVILFFHG